MDNKTSKNKVGNKRGRRTLYDQKRKPHAVYYSRKEWDMITAKATDLDMERGVYIREVSLGYHPVVADPEFRKEIMKIRSDIVNLFKILDSMDMTPEKRKAVLYDFGFLQRWINGVKKELDMLDYWYKRL